MIHVHIYHYNWLMHFGMVNKNVSRLSAKSLNQSLIRNGRNLSVRHDHDEYSWPMLCIQC